MPDEKYIFKEEHSTKSKAAKLLILMVGEAFFVIFLFITIQLFKTEEVGLSKIITYSIGVLFSVFLVIITLLTWGFFHAHKEIRITRTGIKRSYRLPPLAFRKTWILSNSIKSVSIASSNKLIFNNNEYLISDEKKISTKIKKIKVILKNGNTEMIITKNPLDLIKAFKKMFSEGRR